MRLARPPGLARARWVTVVVMARRLRVGGDRLRRLHGSARLAVLTHAQGSYLLQSPVSGR
ncbi:hypothetical protein GCM10017687_30340 [Streptomyces echinatus]